MSGNVNADTVGAEMSFLQFDADDTVADERLRRLYEYPADSDRCVVRANVIASLDGAATTGGTSGGLGGPGDRFLFAMLRELADVIVVGAGTARAEGYGGAHMSVAQRRRRQDRGQSETPPIAVVTRSGAISPDLAVITGSGARPLVLTSESAVEGVADRLGTAAEVVSCSAADPGQVDLATALTGLSERGYRRLLIEGGPSLLGTFIADGLLDEICLTTAPVLVGGSGVRIATGPDEALRAMRRTHLIGDSDGYLYARYVRGHRSR